MKQKRTWKQKEKMKAKPSLYKVLKINTFTSGTHIYYIMNYMSTL